MLQYCRQRMGVETRDEEMMMLMLLTKKKKKIPQLLLVLLLPPLTTIILRGQWQHYRRLEFLRQDDDPRMKEARSN